MILLHSYLRWLILVLFLIVLYKHLRGMLQKRAFEKSDKIFSLLLTINLDITLLIGIVLYFISPATPYQILSQASMSEIMAHPPFRKLVIEHPLQMLIAIVFAHIAAAQRKKEIADTLKHKRMFWFYLIAFVFILAGIPWDRLA